MLRPPAATGPPPPATIEEVLARLDALEKQVADVRRELAVVRE